MKVVSRAEAQEESPLVVTSERLRGTAAAPNRWLETRPFILEGARKP